MFYLPRRLGKYVRDASALSVVEISAAHAAGRLRLVTPEGQALAPALNTLVFETDRVLLDEQELSLNKHPFYALVNKPRGVTSSTCDQRGRADLMRWLDQMPEGVFAVGRLDRETSGLLLFTNDGDLSNAVLRPEHHTTKTYWLWLNEYFEEEDPRLALLTKKDDPRYDGGSEARLAHRTEHYTELTLVLDQGKNRQIRRMCKALDLRLLHLHRKRIGPLSDEDVPLGGFRILADAEVSALWDATGGKETLQARKLQALRLLAERLRQEGTTHNRLEGWLRQLDARAPRPPSGPPADRESAHDEEAVPARY